MIRLIILTFFLATAWVTARGQETTGACGLGKDPKLNKCELDFFDSFFADEVFKKKSYNFMDKKFAFISAGQLIAKDDFFKSVSNYRGPKGFDFFDKAQKTRTGYDGVIMINQKAYNRDNIIKLIERKKKGDD